MPIVSRPRRPEAFVLESYVHAVRSAGGLPLLVAAGTSIDDVPALLGIAHAVVLTGGDTDVHPSLYGADVQGRLDRIQPERTALELALAKACLHQHIPLLGVCGGMQVLAVAAGGTLIQDLPASDDHHLAHEQPNDPAESSHRVRLSQPAALGFEASEIWVNSTHHQAVDDPGQLEVAGRAPDGVVEAVQHPTHPFAVGLQWHPELLGQWGPYEALLRAVQN